MAKILVFLVCIGVCVCDVSLRIQSPSDFGPYHYSKPLPGEYGAPPLPTASSVQISQEQLAFAGQLVEINTPAPNHFAQSNPSNADFLPRESPAKPFRNNLNTGEVFVSERQPFRPCNQQSTFCGTESLNQFQPLSSFNPAPQQVLPREYGAPPNLYPYPAAITTTTTTPPPPPPVHEVINETPADENDDDDHDETVETETDPTVIAVANAASGQYYLLGKDNTLQRVVYKATRDKDDAIKNGFTAHLRYYPVEPIRDPIYGYDDQGHLVRIYNKK